MLDRNILEDIIKTKLLIKYQTSKTLGENLSFINEQKEEWGYEIGKEMERVFVRYGFVERSQR